MLMTNVTKQERLLRESAELEKLMQEGQDPTQPPEVKTEGSPEVKTEGITEQELAAQQNKKPVQDIDYWKDRCMVSENRFNVSKPKYDSNIYKLRAENANLQADRIAISKQLNELRQSIASKRPDEVSDMLNKQEVVDVLGQETADTIRKSIADTHARVDAQEKRIADKEIADQENRLAQSVDTRYNTFMSMLTELVPDQEVMNNDPKFIEYLKGVDEDIGVVRFDLLREAENAGNAARVASFFKSFKKLANKAAPADSINKRISPDSQSVDTTDINTNTGGKISAAYIDKFFLDLNKGRYKGRYSEQIAIQKAIDKAYSAGNIIP
jgi:hypothetical protein